MQVTKRNHVKVLGSGERTLVFAHGFGCDQAMWRHVVPAFEKNYRVVLFDHVGAGNSDASAYDPAKYETLQGYATDVIEILEELDLHDVVFVGHSVSAMIGVLAAIRAPKRIGQLVLVAPSPSYIDDGDYIGGFKRQEIEGMLEMTRTDYFGWARSMGPAVMGNAERPELGHELTNSFCKTNPEIAKQFARVTFMTDCRDDLHKVTQPTLILQCSQDIVAPLPVGSFVHAKIAGSTLRVLEATGHCPHISAPEETVTAMEAFLSDALRSARKAA